MRAEIVVRLLLIAVLVLALAYLFVLAGAKEPFSPKVEPSAEAFAGNAQAYIGDEVEFTGVVVDADSAQVEIGSHDNTVVITLVGAPPLEDGQVVTFEGTAVDATTIETTEDRVVTRDAWEYYYMYTASIVGAILALLVAVNYWTFAWRQVGFVPREQPIIDIGSRDMRG